ncbi:hypothetical protein QUB30_12805 [Microcoleus sp. BROC3]
MRRYKLFLRIKDCCGATSDRVMWQFVHLQGEKLLATPRQAIGLKQYYVVISRLVRQLTKNLQIA